MIEHKLADGETFVDGRSEAKARELLDLAAKAGLDGQVRTTSRGYIVPSAILADGGDAGDQTDSEDQTEEQDTDSEGDTEEQAAKEFDPSEATVDEVKDYLDHADDTERERVLAAEEAGKGRKGILDLAETKGDK